MTSFIKSGSFLVSEKVHYEKMQYVAISRNDRLYEKSSPAKWAAFFEKILKVFASNHSGDKSQGVKQFVAGGGMALIGLTLVPLLKGLFG